MDVSVPLLEVRGLAVRYPIRRGVFARAVGWVRAVEGVSFTVAAGETLGLVGESGCGKSTTSRAILGLVRPDAGEILYEGRPIGSLTRRERACGVQVVFQDPLASLNPRLTVVESVTEAAVVHGLAAEADRRTLAAELLDEVGIAASALDRYPHEFSGGQRQRICIARALALRPRLLICDEAVSALDLTVRAKTLDLLEELKRSRNLGMLFITHDLGVVRHVANRVLVMCEGRIVESGDCAAVLTNPRSAYTRKLVASVPRLAR